jgi:inorganic pyrophosphatase
VDDLHPFYSKVTSYKDLPDIFCEQIAHFFEHYKDLEKGKWVKDLKWQGVDEAKQAILDGIARAKNK